MPALRLDLSAREPNARGPDSGAPPVVTVVGGGGKTSLVLRLARELRAANRRVITATTTRMTLQQAARAPLTLQVHGEAVPWEALRQGLEKHGHCMLVGDETLYGGKQKGVEPTVIDQIAARAADLNLAAILVEGDGSRTLPVKAPGDHEPVIPDSTTLVLTVLGLEAIGAPIDEAHAHRPERIRSLLGLAAGAVRLTPAMAARLLVDAQGGARSIPPAARWIPILNKADAAARRSAGRIVAARLARGGFTSLLTAAGNESGDAVLERWGPLCTVVLAAGASRRYGAPKQLAEVDGEAFVHRAARLALDSGASQVMVVTGAAHAAVTRALADLQAMHGSRLVLHHNPRWDEGQATSLRAALEAMDARHEAVLFLPVDQPHLEVTLLRRLIQAWRRGASLAAPSVDGEVRGAPALFDREHFAALRTVTGDRGGRDLLRLHRDRVLAIAVEAWMLADVDRIEAGAA